MYPPDANEHYYYYYYYCILRARTVSRTFRFD